MTSLPPGYRGYVPDDGFTERPEGFSEVAEAPVVTALDPHDPLVNPEFAGLAGWVRRVRLVIAANWRPLLAVVAVTYGIPTVMLSVKPAGLGPALLSLVIATFFRAALFGGVIWAVTQWATGAPPSWTGALAYGFRRSPRLFGLNLLCDLLVGAGLVALVVPGLYLWFALSLVMPAAVLRQEAPIGASFGLFHRNAGPVLARVALAAGAPFLIRAGLLIAVFAGARGPAFTLFELGVDLVVGMPLQVLAIVGLTLTHVEMTARTTPITSASLLAAL